MTTEEKAKAYDEALEKARKKYNSKYHPSKGPSGVYLNNADLEEIFPVLKENESEDERIRKWLIEEIKATHDYDSPTSRKCVDDALAYLEKQKAKERLDRMAPIYNDKESFESALEKAWKYYNESTSRTVDSFEDDYIECVFSKGFREGFLYKEKQKDKMTAEEYENPELFQLKLKTKYANGYQDGLVQKEQKPAEWSEKDKDYYDAIIAKLEVTQDDAMLTDNQMDFLKSLPERLNLQPKQEWSEDYNEEKIQTRFAFYTYKDDPSVLYLSNIFVEETSRNHGFGTRILKAAEKVAEAVGATTIRLKAKQNSPANAWYRKNGYRYVAFEDGYDWLEKNLEYMKPNKQEWNEKDNIMLDNIILCLKEYCLTDEINWLKSLRPKPHWKPSEEQMYYLKKVYESYYFCDGERTALESLYNDLEKLL